jgi:hypothetical protein
MSLGFQVVASAFSEYKISQLYPAGLPPTITFVYYLKADLNLVTTNNDFCYYAQLIDPSSTNQVVGGGYSPTADIGAIYRTNVGTSGVGSITQNPPLPAFTMVTVQYIVNNILSPCLVRYNDVVGNVAFPNASIVNVAQLFNLRADYQDFTIAGEHFKSKGYQGQKIGSIAIYNGALTDAEVAEIAEKKNITDPKYTTGGRTLNNYWEFFDDWGTGDIPDLGSNPVPLTGPYPNTWVYDSENPTTPIKLESSVRTGFGNKLFIISSLAGTIHAVRQTAGSTPPADAAAIINATVGGDILEVLSTAATVGSISGDELDFVTGDSFTEYDYHYALAESTGAEIQGFPSATITTCGYIENNTAPLQTVDGNVISGPIFGSWFDNDEALSLSQSVEQAQIEVNSSGVFVLSLPNSTLAQGEEGMLTVQNGTALASYVLEVK